MPRQAAVFCCFLQLHVLLTVHVARSMYQNVETCPPGEIGKPYTIECRGSSDFSDSDLVWMLHGTGRVRILSECEGYQDHCKQLDPFMATASRPRLQDSFSILRIPKLKQSHHNLIFTCELKNQVPNETKTNVLSTCNLKVYAKPENPKCEAERTGDFSVDVICSTEKVFPGLNCHISQLETLSLRLQPISTSLIKYRQPSSDFSKHICFTNVTLDVSGGYEFFAAMKPALDNLPESAVAVTERVSQAILTPFLRMVEPHLPIELCEDEAKAIDVYCEAHEFWTQPDIYWFEDDVEIPNTNGALTVVSGEDNTSKFFTSVLRLVVSREKDDVRIKCGARSKDSKEHGIIFGNTTRLDVRGPPYRRPLFIDPEGKELTENKVTIHGNSTNWACSIPGGKPSVTNTNIKCVRINDLLTVLERSVEGNIIKFDLSATEKEKWNCACSASHESGCYNNIAILEVNFNGILVDETNSKSVPTATITVICSIIIVISIVVLLCLGVRKLRRNHDYEKVRKPQPNGERAPLVSFHQNRIGPRGIKEISEARPIPLYICP